MTTYLQCLPTEVLSHIYGYDNTYKEILNDKVFKEVTKKAWIVWFRNHDVNLKYRSNLNLIKDNAFAKSICRCIIPYWFEIFWAEVKESYNSADYESYYFNNYHPSDVTVSIVETIGQFYHVYIKFEKNLVIFSGFALSKENWEKYYEDYKDHLLYSDNEIFLVRH
jgi:Fe-S cluster biosynthesis and repair protein YggX